MTDKDKIILYDIPSRLTPMAWSPNTWKARYVLNYKGLPYETVWVHYTEIAALWAELGLEPITDPSISKFATFLPVISVPPKNGKGPRTVIAESYNIALYLERAFPETLCVIPPHTAALQNAFIQTLTLTVFVPLRPIMIPQVPLILGDPKGAAHFARTREPTFLPGGGGESGNKSIKLSEVSPRGSEKRKADMENAKRALEALGRIFKCNQGEEDYMRLEKSVGVGKNEHGWIMGAVGPTFADFAVGAIFRWIQSVEDVVLVPDGDIGEAERGELWNLIRTMEGGKWAKYAERFKEWEQVM